jgi:hypothetical protein
LLQLAGPLTLWQMLMMTVFGAALFGVGRIVEGYSV